MMSAACVIVAAGSDYLNAAVEDIEAVARHIGNERMAIISAGAMGGRLPQSLQSCLMPMGVEWETALPGVRSSLNHRMLEWVVEHAADVGTIDLSELREAVARHSEKLAQHRPKRQVVRRTDDEIRTWIAEALLERPNVSASALLVRFRRHASCEQSRFLRLVDVVRSQDSANRV